MIELKNFMEYEDSIGVPHWVKLEDARVSIPEVSHLKEDELYLYIKRYEECMSKSTRFEDRKVHDQDTKYLYHLVRLLNQCEQILTKGDMDIQENREQYKSIRRGEWSINDIIQYFYDKEKQLEELYSRSKLREVCDESKLKQILLDCIEMHYGDLSKCITNLEEEKQILNEIALSIDRARAKNLI